MLKMTWMQLKQCWRLKLSTEFCPHSVGKAYYYKKLNNTSRWDPLELLKIRSVHFLCWIDVRHDSHGWWRYCCYWLWIEIMKHWFLMLLHPMLFINVICSYHTCTPNMLVKLHERQFWERQKYYKVQRKEIQFCVFTILHVNNGKEMRNNWRI